MAMLNLPSTDLTLIGTLRRMLARSPRRRALPGPVIKLDRRLLADVGLTEQDVLGVEGMYWREWDRSRLHWSL
jgi:hypothetical protein